MKEYKVVSPYRLRDKDWKPTKGHASVGDSVLLSPIEARRLIKSRCVEEVETRVINPSENRKSMLGSPPIGKTRRKSK